MRITLTRSIPLVLTLGLVAGACSDSERAGEPLAPETGSRASVAEQSMGAMVVRDEHELFFFHFDAKRGLLSAHLPSDRCLGAPLNVGDRQIVTTPSAIQQELVKAVDTDSHVAVYRASSMNDLFPDICGFLLGPNKVAEGVVRHTQTFTNASFAAHWGGFIEGVDGGTLHLSETYQLTASAQEPDNPAYWSLNASQILLRGAGGQ